MQLLQRKKNTIEVCLALAPSLDDKPLFKMNHIFPPAFFGLFDCPLPLFSGE